MSNLQLNRLKSGTKNGTEVTLNVSSNLIGNSNDEADFPYKFLLTNTQILRVCKASWNSSSVSKKISKS